LEILVSVLMMEHKETVN